MPYASIEDIFRSGLNITHKNTLWYLIMQVLLEKTTYLSEDHISGHP